MNQVTKSTILIFAIVICLGLLLLTIGLTGYHSALQGITDSIQKNISQDDQKAVELQKRELELITEVENRKIIESINEQQRILDLKEQELIEKEKSINALAELLEQEKNNFLSEKEKQQQDNQRIKSYDQKLTALANNFIAMPPEQAVERIVTLNDDLLIIDVIEKIDEIAVANDQASISPYYYSLMKKEDASRLLKKSTISF